MKVKEGRKEGQYLARRRHRGHLERPEGRKGGRQED
jgi:hypothetical protein